MRGREGERGSVQIRPGLSVSHFSSSCFLCCSHRASRCSALFRAAYQRTEAHLQELSLDSLQQACSLTGADDRRLQPHLVLLPEARDQLLFPQDGCLHSGRSEEKQGR